MPLGVIVVGAWAEGVVGGPAEHEVATGAAGALEVSDKELFE
jgi:hypothetical protein